MINLVFSVLIMNFGHQIFTSARPWHWMKNYEPLYNNGRLAPNTTQSLCYITGGNNKYFVIRKLMDWIEAKDMCDHFCSNIAYFTNTAELAKVSSLLLKMETDPKLKNSKKLSAEFFKQKGKYEFTSDRRYWIGLNDLGREGVWLWSGTKLAFDLPKDVWYPNQPDHLRNKGQKTAAGSEHCVTLWNPVFYQEGQEHTFNDEPCNMKYYALCMPPDTKKRAKSEKANFDATTGCLVPDRYMCGS